MSIIKFFILFLFIGSISKAADFLYISQPAVTKSIKKLESELGITLFNRTPKGVSLTENGKIFYGFIKNGVESFMNGERKLTSLKNLESGTIKIGASTTVTKYFLLPFIEKFHMLYPNVDISITNNLTSNLISLLKNGSLDLLVINFPLSVDDSLNIIPCAVLHDCFVSNLSYKKQIIKPIALSDLVQNYPIIAQKEPSSSRLFLDSFMIKNDISFKPKFEVVSYGLVKDFAKIGMGISYVTKEFAEDDFKSELLFEIPIKEKIPERNLGIALPKNTISSFATEKLVDLILKTAL